MWVKIFGGTIKHWDVREKKKEKPNRTKNHKDNYKKRHTHTNTNKLLVTRNFKKFQWKFNEMFNLHTNK